MFLKKIRIQNFKCHADLTLDLTTPGEAKVPVRKTTFVTGENGAGKTALLQAIALVTGGSEVLWHLRHPDAYIRRGQDAALIDATITTAGGEERALSLTLERGEPVREAVLRARTSLAPMDAALRHTHRSYFVAGYGSGRRVDPAPAGTAPLYPGTSFRYAAVHSLFDRDALLRPLPQWSADVLQRGGAAAMSVLARAIDTFLPEAVRFSAITPEGRVYFDTPDGRLPLEALSNGYQQTVAWVGDLLYHLTRTFGDYKNPLAARGLLLIDEADMHLHPSWQAQLHRFLARGLPQMQVVAAAYSPATAGEAGPEEVVALGRIASPAVETRTLPQPLPHAA